MNRRSAFDDWGEDMREQLRRIARADREIVSRVIDVLAFAVLVFRRLW